uniref:Uncharacterized protein n=1 Tax=Corvus moneduloides TaxID=1196302 RepID=A0A8C3EQX4_CORMO
ISTTQPSPKDCYSRAGEHQSSLRRAGSCWWCSLAHCHLVPVPQTPLGCMQAMLTQLPRYDAPSGAGQPQSALLATRLPQSHCQQETRGSTAPDLHSLSIKPCLEYH